MKHLLDRILSHPLIVLTLFVVASAILGWQARHFEIDASADTLLTENNRHYIETRVMNERFSPQEFLLIAYEPHSGQPFSGQSLDDLRELSARLRDIERVSSIRSVLNVPLLTLMDDSVLTGDPLEWTLEQKDFTAAQLQEALSDNPIYEELIVNEEQTATALQVLFRPDQELASLQAQITEIQKESLERQLTDEERAEIEALREQVAPLERALNETRNREIETIQGFLSEYRDDAQLYLGGAHVLSYQLIQIIRSDLLMFGGIIAAVICLVLLLLFRHLRWVMLPVICCGASVLLTVGLFGLLDIKTTVISSNFIALQLILTLAIVVHLIVQYRELITTCPEWDQKQLLRETLTRKMAPCFYAGLTTSVGFASLLFTNIQPVESFGWMMIIAMTVSIATSLVLFPAMLALFEREPGQNRNRISHGVLTLFTHISTHRTGLILVFSAIVLLISGAGLLRLNVENSFINYFAESTEVHKGLSFIDRELGGSTPLDVIVTAPESRQEQDQLVLTAETVQKMEDVEAMLQQQHGMGKTLSIVSFTRLARELNDDRPLTEYELTAIYRTISDDLREDLLGSFFSPEHSQLRISARIQDATENLDRGQLMENIHTGMQELGIPETRYSLTNLFVLYQDILQRLFTSQILALGLVYLVLTLMFAAIFRSLRLALIGIAPNILSTISVLGFMGWLGIPLDLMTITIASIAMGIAVDDTIHYVHRYQEERRQSVAKAIRNTNFSVGYALLYTSAIITLGFSQLAFSDFIPSVHFGLLASLAMIMALVWNLSLLPVLLQRFTGPGKSSKA